MVNLMKSYRLVGSLLASLMLCSAATAADPNVGPSLAKRRVLADLDCIYNMFDVKYAPKAWKQEFGGWDLNQAIAEAKNKVNDHPALTTKDSQIILRDFFNSTKDYHVGARFFSTESANLPFLIKGAKGRYFVCYVDREQLSRKEFPFDVGDEILTFGGKPIHEAVEELRLREFGSNTYETDQALAELSLTHRRGDLGQIVPSGSVEISGHEGDTSKITKIKLNWRYIPEKIKDFSKLGLATEMHLLQEGEEDLPTMLKKSQFFEKFMVCAFWDKSYVGGFTELNKHSLGARSSFIPPLGKKIWKSSSDAIFEAYIFETPAGKKIGYIRLPHYMGDVEEVEEFGSTVTFFQKRTDALVIDQVNNPGGSVFYLYALAATLTDKPLFAPKHHLAMTQEDVYIAQIMLPYLEQVTSDETARLVLGDTICGYPIDFHFVKMMKQFCNFLTKQWSEGKLFSDPTHLFGVDQVQPHPKYSYTKPILLLINSLDFSCGDFFPAIMQDNKRATLLGSRTAGAGGYVLPLYYPNHVGMKYFLMTGSIAERLDKKPIENLGVRPDVHYEFSVTDLQEDYKEYVSAILETVESLAKNS